VAVLDVNWNPGTKELRQFAAMWLVFFSAIAAYVYFRTDSGWLSPYIGGAAVVIGSVGLAVPKLMKPIYVGWMAAAFPIGWTVSHLLLGSIFYLLIAPIGLVVRATGHDPMNRKFDPKAKTYWIEHRTGADPSSYFRQF
jgi:hypothetical protein